MDSYLPAAVLVIMVGAVGDAGIVDTFETWLADARRRHADGEYWETLLLEIVESAGHRPRRESKPFKEKQSTTSTSAKDADSSAGGKKRGNKEASCSLVGVMEPTVPLAPEAGEDLEAVATVMRLLASLLGEVDVDHDEDGGSADDCFGGFVVASQVACEACSREFLGKEFTGFVDGKGIIHNWTCPYIPHQNSMAEREMRTAMEFVRKMLLHMGVQHQRRHLVMRQAVWVRNCLERSTLPPGRRRTTY
ncbi:unnamed protein product [Closterium sp. NIES-54]